MKPLGSTRASRITAILVVLLSLAGLFAPAATASLDLVTPDPTKTVTFFGHGGYSADGLGQSSGGGTVQAEVPSGSSIYAARLYGTYIADWVLDEASRTISFDGSDVVLTEMLQNEHAFVRTAVADVTSRVATKVGSGGACDSSGEFCDGIYDFVIGNDPQGLDGVALVVIYSNPDRPEVSIAVMEGGLRSSGQTTTLHFTEPVHKTDGFAATMALGIGYSYQGGSGAGTHECGGTDQRSVIVTDPTTGAESRLTSCAGNYDDGYGSNGGLITVGGIGDSTANPLDPFSTSSGEGDDDELYNIAPFIGEGSSSFGIQNENPSGDDNIFLAILSVTAQLSVGAGPRLTVDRTHVPASPSSMPLEAIALQPGSPIGSGIGGGSIIGSPLGGGSIIGSPLGGGSIIGSPLGGGSIIGSPLGGGSIIGSPLGGGSIIGSPLPSAALGTVPLSTLPLNTVKFPGGWNWVLAETSFVGVPLQDVSLKQVLAISPAPSRLAQVTWSDIDWSQSSLGSISMTSIAMGGVTLGDFAFSPTAPTVCFIYETNGYSSCGSSLGGLAATFMGLEIGGFTPDAFHVDSIMLSNINLTRAGFLAVKLTDIRDRIGMANTPIGSIRLSELPNRAAVVTCTLCTDDSTLADNASSLTNTATVSNLGIMASGRWTPIARLSTLTLAEMLYSFVSLADNPYEALSLERMTSGYTGPGSSVINYRFDYIYRGTAAVDMPTVSVTLPETFGYIRGSSSLSTPPAATTLADPSISGSILSWALNGISLESGERVRIDFQALPGLKLGTFSASAGISGTGLSELSADQAAVTVGENFEPNGTVEEATPMSKDEIYLGHNSTASDIELFSYAPPVDGTGVPIPGTRLDFMLGHLTYNATLVVYLPPGAYAADLRSSGLGGGSIIGSPLGGGSIIGSPLGGGSIIGSPVEDDGLEIDNDDRSIGSQVTEDIPLLLDRPVASISANPSTEDETAAVVVPEGMPAGSSLIVQVTGQLGDTSPLPFSLRAKEIGGIATPPCAPRSLRFPADGSLVSSPMPSSVSSDRKTLFIADWERMARAYGASETQEVIDKLSPSFLERSDVMGVVLPVGSVPAVATASDDWDDNPCSVRAANEFVRQINLAVNAVLEVHRPDIDFITIVGPDEVIPFGRVRDFTTIVNETQYVQDLSFTTSTNANPTPRSNALMASAAGGFIQTDDVYGDFQPELFLNDYLYRSDVATSRLVEDPQQIADQIQRFVDFNGLLDPQTALTTGYDFNSDMAQDLDAVLGNRLAAANAYDLISETWTKTQLRNMFTHAAVAPAMVFPQGHANHFALLGAAGNTTQDMTDTFTSADVSGGNSLSGRIIASIGCHFGLNVSDVMLGVPANTANLTQDQVTRFNDFAQAFFGKGAASLAANTGTGYGDSQAIAYSEKLVNLYGRNLQKGEISGNAFNLAKHEYFSQLGALSVFDAKALQEFTYYGLLNYRLAGTTAPSSAQTPPPLGPDPTGTTGLMAATLQVDNTFTQKNGTTGSYFVVGSNLPQVTNYRPVTAITGQDITVPGTEPAGAIITGLESSDLNNFNPAISVPVEDRASLRPEPQFDGVFPSRLQSINSYVGRDGTRYRLNLMATQFRSTGLVGGNQKGSMRKFSGIDVQVFYADPARSDRLAPVIRTVEGGKLDATTLAVEVSLSDETPATNDIAGGILLYKDGPVWKSATFQDLGSDEWSTTTPLTAAMTEYFVQFWDTLGNVAISSNDGRNFGDASAPKVSIFSPQENARFKLNQVVYGNYTCTDTGSGLADDSCKSDVPVGGAIDTSTPGLHKFTVRAADKSGNVVNEERTYFVDYVFVGFKTPLKNTDDPSGDMNSVNAGRAIPLKWELRDVNGVSQGNLTQTQVSLSWRLINCGTRGEASLDLPVTTISTPFAHDPVTKQYTWVIDTPKDPAWPGTCRRLIATFNGTEAHFVDFSFR